MPGAFGACPALYLLATGRLIVVNVDPFQLQVMVPAVSACWVDAVLIADDLPELPGERMRYEYFDKVIINGNMH